MQFTQEDKDYIACSLSGLSTQHTRLVTINGISLPLKGTENITILERIYTRAEKLASTDVSKFPEFHIEPGTHIYAACLSAIEQKYLPAAIDMNGRVLYLFEDDRLQDAGIACRLWGMMRERDDPAKDLKYHLEELGRD